MSTPALQFSRPETTDAVTRGAARLLAALGWAPVAEFPLPNGRRADLMALGPKGEFAIVEVKSSVEDYRVRPEVGRVRALLRRLLLRGRRLSSRARSSPTARA